MRGSNLNEAFYQLVKRTPLELKDLELVLQRIEEGWQRARRSGDNYYLDSVALNLHGFYSGLERIFELVAQTVDRNMPQGENWHQVLLQQMAQENPGVRPAIISSETYQLLTDYRGFSHVVRNVYTYHFDSAKLERLVANAPMVFEKVKLELEAFVDFLGQRLTK